MAIRTAGTSHTSVTNENADIGRVTSRLLQFNVDARIDITNLQKEFLNYPSDLFAYNEAKAAAEALFDKAKAAHEEAEAESYIRVKSGETKVTEKHAEALVLLDPLVKAAFLHMLDVRRDFETIKNYVESMRAKKDCLIQLGADSRKE